MAQTPTRRGINTFNQTQTPEEKVKDYDEMILEPRGFLVSDSHRDNVLTMYNKLVRDSMIITICRAHNIKTDSFLKLSFNIKTMKFAYTETKTDLESCTLSNDTLDIIAVKSYVIPETKGVPPCDANSMLTAYSGRLMTDDSSIPCTAIDAARKLLETSKEL